MFMFCLSSYTEKFRSHIPGLYPGFVTPVSPWAMFGFSHIYTEDIYFSDLFEDLNLNELVYVQCFENL